MDRHKKGLAKHRTHKFFGVGVDPGCQCFFLRCVFLVMLCDCFDGVPVT